jgi:hypothetical protein
MFIRIDKKTFKSFLKKLKKSGVKEVKVKNINRSFLLDIETIERNLKLSEFWAAWYITEFDTIIIETNLFDCIIVKDENFDELKEMVKVNYVIEQL